MFTTFAVLFLAGTTLFAQSDAPPVEEIAAAYIEAIGGEEAWLSLKASQLEGKAMMQGMEMPMTITTAEGDKMRLDMSIQGNAMTQTYDGETGYILFPLQGITEPKEMSEEEVADFADEPFLNEFINSAERGYTLEAVEGKEVEGAPTYGVRVTHENGFDRTYYFDTESMVPIMMTSVGKGGPLKGMPVNMYFSEYGEVDGMYMPMFMEQKMNGQSIMKMTFSDVRLNPELEEGFFSLK
jgi:outer membrane lipoprotein-sorting protein